MKTLIVFLLACFILTSSLSQEKLSKERERIVPIKPRQLTDEEQFKISIDFIIQYYGKSFVYYEQLINGNYDFKRNSNDVQIYYLNIYENVNERASRSKKQLSTIVFHKKKAINGNYEISFDRNEIEKFVNDFNKRDIRNTIQYIENFIVKDSILLDTMILYHEEIRPDYWKILNKDFTMKFLDNQNGEDAVLFMQPEAGVILPYNNGNQSKIVITDNQFHSNLYFDSDIFNFPNEPINGYYGSYGIGHGEFCNPTGICVGRKVVSGSTTYYPIYIVNNREFRIVVVNFVINGSIPALSQFDNNSFLELGRANLPYDISYFEHLEDPALDKVWVSESNPFVPRISCYMLNGTRVQRFLGYIDTNTNQTYLFQQGTRSRIKVYNKYFGAISFVDNIRNCLVSCQLNYDGTARYVPYEDGYLIKAHDILNFPMNEKISSVSFQMVSSLNSGWPYVWVTSTNMIHCAKMNANAHVQYLASTQKPLNTDLQFHDLNNVLVTNGLSELLTMERWTNIYGFRKYLPFVSVYRDSVTSYCLDSTDIIRMYGTFTNDCHLYITAKRKKQDNTWESVKIKKFNGQINNNGYYATKFQLAGQNQASSDLFNDLVLDLPIEDYALNGQVKITVNMFPEYSGWANFGGRYVTREYITNVNRACLPLAGGCPFLYVKNDSGKYKPDNNVLHRSEFSEPGVDILDLYKLRINPSTEDNKIEVALVENENDFGFIDQFQLFAIDFPANKKLGITEDNEIVLYDSATVYASDTVMLNTTNITVKVNYHNPSTTFRVGYKNDSLYAHFSYPNDRVTKIKDSKIKDSRLTDGQARLKESRDATDKEGSRSNDKGKETRAKSYNGSIRHPDVKYGTGLTDAVNEPIGFITELGNLTYPIAGSKDTAGYLTATSVFSNTVSKMFARREFSSVVIVPLFDESNRIDNLNIDWQSDFRMKYVGAANLEYYGYEKRKTDMSEGRYITATSDIDITSALMYIDQNYGEVNSSGLIKMRFDISNLPPLPKDSKREYIVEVTGRYVNGGDNVLSKVKVQIPLTYKLLQNYPNPFNPTTKINYELPRTSKVSLVIYDILGREVVKLVNNEFKEAGRYVVEFDAKNFASGVYFYRIEAGSFVDSKKMVLIK